MNQCKKISVVFSVYNERESLEALFSNISGLISNLSYYFELIFVDDGSTDGSDKMIRNYGTMNPSNSQVMLIRLSRNFGHEAAMIAGIDHALGDAIICMDADLQHPVELIPSMISSYESGSEIVTMIRNRNNGSTPRSSRFSRFFYCLFNWLSDHKLQENASDFFLVSKKVAEILKSDFRERKRFLRGVIQTIGFPSTTMNFIAPARSAGKTKYSFLKLTSLTAQAITSFSNAPLFLGIWFGFLFGLLSVILGIYSLIVFFFGETPPQDILPLFCF